MLENVSTYVQFSNSEMTEWEFLSELSRRSGCWLLFDVNNVYVSAFNHGYDPLTFLNGIPADRVVQFHMAGHSHMGTHIIDTHDHPVCEDVWELYAAALKRFGRVSTMIERDTTFRRSTNCWSRLPGPARSPRRSCLRPSMGMSDFARQQAEFQRGILSGDDTVLSEILDSPGRSARRCSASIAMPMVRGWSRPCATTMSCCIFISATRRSTRWAMLTSRRARPDIRTCAGSRKACRNFRNRPRPARMLSDLAALEKALNDAFDAAEGKVVELTDMAAAPEAWSGLRFGRIPVHPGLILRPTRPRSGSRSRTTKRRRTRPDWAAVHLLIWRQDVTPMFRELAEEEAMMWDEAANGIPFGVLCEMLATMTIPTARRAARGYLHGWITAGLLTDVSVGS